MTRADADARAGVGVVIPVYNRARLVWDALDSVARQTRPPRRLVVVDDGSEDGTAESVERWLATRAPRFETRVLRQTNRGAAAARNRGVRELADCDKLLFLDSDDIIPPDFLERTAAELDAHPEAVAATVDCDYLRMRKGREGDPERLGFYEAREICANPTAWVFMWACSLMSCTLCRARAAEQAGLFNERLLTGHDAEFFVNLFALGGCRPAPGAPAIVRVTRGFGAESWRLHQRVSGYAVHWAYLYARLSRRPEVRDAVPSAKLADAMRRRWWRLFKSTPQSMLCRPLFMRLFAEALAVDLFWKVRRHLFPFTLRRERKAAAAERERCG